jgi:large subunit ribosomal protein L31
MQANIHPKYEKITVTCSCGHVFETSSVLCKNINIEVCNACHPFYTGKQKIMDTAGRVERFKGKFGSFSFKGVKEDAATDSDPAEQ